MNPTPRAMRAPSTRVGAPALALTAALACAGALQGQSAPSSGRVERFPTNPLLTVASSPSPGGNVNGPTIIRVPEWVENALGRYYMYFANHEGDFIGLAYADDVRGPWHVRESGVLHVRETAFDRPQPDPAGPRADFYTHVASPEILVDHARRRLVLWVHGWWTNGERWPAELPAARTWAREHGYGQFTQAFESTDGLEFSALPAITRTSYLRVFGRSGVLYGVSRLGVVSRAADPREAFEVGRSLFRDGAYAGRARHVALVPRPNELLVYFTAIGDAPERVLLSRVPLEGDWSTWRASEPVEVLSPEASYECADLPDAPSSGGDIDEPARQMRDPFVFQDDGQVYLFYTTCGEQGIAGATLELP